MQPKTILIIDNNIDFITSALNVLSKDKDVDEVIWSLTTDDIRKKIDIYNPGIIVLDLGMKGSEEIQDFVKYSINSPILLITSFSDNNEYLQMSKELGADGFCLKDHFPDAFSQLKEVMDKGITALFNKNSFSMN